MRWLSRTSAKIVCSVVFENEGGEELNLHSNSMRGAQREVTRYLIHHEGYTPDGRWVYETDAPEDSADSWRRFTPPSVERRDALRAQRDTAIASMGSTALTQRYPVV